MTSDPQPQPLDEDEDRNETWLRRLLLLLLILLGSFGCMLLASQIALLGAKLEPLRDVRSVVEVNYGAGERRAAPLVPQVIEAVREDVEVTRSPLTIVGPPFVPPVAIPPATPTAIALITLAIGIGANTIMFSVVNTLVFRPVQVKEFEKLVCCKIRNFGFGTMPYSAYKTIREDSSVFSNMMVQDDGIGYVTLAHGQTARQVCGMFVSANYFSFLGVTPAFGRGFLPEEERQDVPSVAVLS